MRVRTPEKIAYDRARYWEKRNDPVKWAEVLEKAKAWRKRKTAAGESYQGDKIKCKLREFRYLVKPEVEAAKKARDAKRNASAAMKIYHRERARKRRASEIKLRALIKNGVDRYEKIAREIHDKGYSL